MIHVRLCGNILLPSFPGESENEFELTKIPHAFLVCVIQEKIALLDSPVDLEAKTQACILHQVRQDVLSEALARKEASRRRRATPHVRS